MKSVGGKGAVLDLRTCKLVPGGRETFDRIFREGALPMLERYGVQVVGYGLSLVDDDHGRIAGRAFDDETGRFEASWQHRCAGREDQGEHTSSRERSVTRSGRTSTPCLAARRRRVAACVVEATTAPPPTWQRSARRG
jgi:hypothetical protein